MRTVTSTTMKRAAAGLATAALTIGGTAAGAGAEEPALEPEDVTTSWTAGIELSTAQAEQLRAAWQQNEDISPQQVLEATGVSSDELAAAAERSTADGVAPADEGSGEVVADCSRMSLWGDSEGRWTWRNSFFPRLAGPAEFGSGSVTTDGIGATSDSFGIAGLDQYEGDQLYFAGVLPSRTQATAWSFNYDAAGSPKLCWGTVIAVHE